jgi:ATPase complex subunit ATP10
MISAKALDGSVVTLPQDTLGFVSLVAIAFRRNSQGMIDSWTGPVLRDFGGDPRVRMYEIPMISPLYRFVAGWIDRGMRSGITVNRHPFVVTYYGNLTPYKLALDMDDPALAYFFLLDRHGRIRWKGSGYAEPDSLKGLEDQVRSLLSMQVQGRPV